MIVDDEPGIVDVVQRYFALSGYEVIAAQSGEEALKKDILPSRSHSLGYQYAGSKWVGGLCAHSRPCLLPYFVLTARIERSDKNRRISGRRR